jgi:hypothetical protein
VKASPKPVLGERPVILRLQGDGATSPWQSVGSSNGLGGLGALGGTERHIAKTAEQVAFSERACASLRASGRHQIALPSPTRKAAERPIAHLKQLNHLKTLVAFAQPSRSCPMLLTGARGWHVGVPMPLTGRTSAYARCRPTTPTAFRSPGPRLLLARIDAIPNRPDLVLETES